MNTSDVWPDAPAQLSQNLREEFLANRGNEARIRNRKGSRLAA